jgi:hypothetical protein
MRLLSAAALYFVVVFVAGFLLGSVRVFWLEPRMEKALAVLCESPFLLLAMVLAARWTTERFRMTGDRTSLAAIGVGALVLQQIADLSLGTTLRGLTLVEQLQNFGTPAGAIYAVLLLLFAAMPLLVSGKRKLASIV